MSSPVLSSLAPSRPATNFPAGIGTRQRRTASLRQALRGLAAFALAVVCSAVFTGCFTYHTVTNASPGEPSWNAKPRTFEVAEIFTRKPPAQAQFQQVIFAGNWTPEPAAKTVFILVNAPVDAALGVALLEDLQEPRRAVLPVPLSRAPAAAKRRSRAARPTVADAAEFADYLEELACHSKLEDLMHIPDPARERAGIRWPTRIGGWLLPAPPPGFERKVVFAENKPGVFVFCENSVPMLDRRSRRIVSAVVLDVVTLPLQAAGVAVVLDSYMGFPLLRLALGGHAN